MELSWHVRGRGGQIPASSLFGYFGPNPEETDIPPSSLGPPGGRVEVDSM